MVIAYGNLWGQELINSDEILSGSLSSPSYAQRQASMRRLWERGDQGTLRHALSSDDAEVRSRASWVLDRWQAGLTADMSPEVVRLLQATAADVDVVALTQAKQLDYAVSVAVDKGDTATLRRMQIQTFRKLPFITDLAITHGQTEGLLQLMQQRSSVPIIAFHLAHLKRNLGYELQECLRLPPAASQMSSTAKQLLEILLHWSFRKHQEAIELATQYDSDLLTRMLLAHGDWQRLATEAGSLAREVTLPEAELVRYSQAESYITRFESKLEHMQLELAGLQRSGQTDELKARLQELSVMFEHPLFRKAVRIVMASESRRREWKRKIQSLAFGTAEALIAVDAPDLAAAILTEFDPSRCVQLMVERSDYTEAFKLLGVDPSDLDNSLIALARETHNENDAFEPEVFVFGASKFDCCLEAAGYANTVGHGLAARRALKILASIPLQDGQNLRMQVIDKALTRIDIDFAIDLAEPLLRSTALRGNGAEALYRASLGPDLWSVISKNAPELSVRERAGLLVDLSLAKLPENYQEYFDLEQLAQDLLLDLRSDGEMFSADRAREAGNLFVNLSRSDLADLFYSAALRVSDSLDLKLSLARRAFRRGDIDTACQKYEELWHANPTKPHLLVGFAKSLHLKGLEDVASDIEKRLRLLALDASQYYEIAHQYDLFRDNDSARFFASKVIDYSPADVAAMKHYAELAQYKALVTLIGIDGNRSPKELANLQRKRLDLLLGTTQLVSFSHYLSIAFSYNQAMADDALADHDVAKAREYLQLGARHLPANIDFGETGLIAMRKGGHIELADDLANEIINQSAERIEQFPLNATLLNNTAWVAALHDQQLDRALDYSERAVSLRPATFSYRDTLAEVLFHRDEISEAILVEENCLYDEPDDFHIHVQLKRFRKKLARQDQDSGFRAQAKE